MNEINKNKVRCEIVVSFRVKKSKEPTPCFKKSVLEIIPYVDIEAGLGVVTVASN